MEIVTHFSMAGGIGSGAAGFNDADPSIGMIKGKMVCAGGIDSDPRACRDFKRLTGVAQACIDLFTLGMYRRYHGHMPPPGWRECTPQDVRDAAHGLFPDIIFTSMPCKGFSGLLSAQKATTDKYAALNELVPRSMMLAMEAFADNPPGLYLFENVPRIASRGRALLDQVDSLMKYYGYVGAETVHDCGELGEGLAQSRRRMLKVYRHTKKVPPFLYEPHKRRLHAVGDVLRHMPLPGDMGAGGPMHRVPALQWKTWVRLAFVEAGSDWRSLNRLAVEDGKLRDYLLVPGMHHGVLGVNRWEESMGTVPGRSGPLNGNYSVADVRFDQSAKWKDGQALGVRRWEESTGTVAGQTGPLQGAYSVADVRHQGVPKHSNEFRIVAWDRAAMAVTSAHGSGQGVADPRPRNDGPLFSKYPVTDWNGSTGTVIGGDDMGAYAVADLRREGPAFAKYSVADYGEPARTVISGSTTGQGAFAVADVRPGLRRGAGDHYLTGGHYGVVPWSAASGAVSASACHDNGPWSCADPRGPQGEQEGPGGFAMPAANDKLVCRIQALDGTWHRPFTTLELAALQSLIDPEEWFSAQGPGGRGEHFVLDGESDQRWREGIGNAVPRKSAKAIAQMMGQTILLARSGETFALGSTPIWVRPLAVALSVGLEGGVA